MFTNFSRTSIGKEAYFTFIPTNKFKSNRITVSLVTKLDYSKATTNALIPFVLRKGSRMCPDFTTLNRTLAKMYGAELEADVSKLADCQVIELYITFLDDRYSISENSMSFMAAQLLADIVFDPPFDENGLFRSEDVELEKEFLRNLIIGELDDKRTYAVSKLCELIFDGEPFAIKRYGYLDKVDEITPKTLRNAWDELVSKSRIEIMMTGIGKNDNVRKVFEDKITKIDRNPENYVRSKPKAYTEYIEKTETMDIAQGKLVMGFRMGAPETEKEKDAARVMAILYGATPFSKLFTNVREKMSLCYYASASFQRRSGIMLVDSGIECINYQKTKDEIIRQLELLKKGDFTDEELEETKLIIRNSLQSVDDSLGAIESWYFTGILDGTPISPSEDIDNIYSVTREDIIEAAKKAELAATFFLKGAEKN